MEKINSFEQENNTEKKENIIIHAVFIRHGEKMHDPNTAETGLTPRGEEKSFSVGKSMESRDMSKPYSSDTSRTRKTAELVVSGSPTENKGETRDREELAFVYDQNGKLAETIKKIRLDILGEDFNNLDDEEKKKRLNEASIKQMDYYLKFGDKRPDAETYSPVETASGIAKLVDRYVAMSDRLKPGSNVDLINATHDLNLVAFLKEAIIREIDGEKVRGFNSIKEIGGPIDFNESFEVLIDRRGKEEVEIKMIFRGQEYGIDMERVKELVEVHENLEK